MSVETLKSLETATRNFVNERRKEVGGRATSRLSKGWPGHGAVCCLAMSLKCVGVDNIGHNDADVVSLYEQRDRKGRARHFIAPSVVKFCKAFDAGQYQHLEKPSSPITHKKPGARKAEVVEPGRYANGDVA